LFGGDDCLAELNLVVSADGIDLQSEAKKKSPDIIEEEGDDE
jgi:hypothetical protein